jgi:hypothetical protein
MFMELVKLCRDQQADPSYSRVCGIRVFLVKMIVGGNQELIAMSLCSIPPTLTARILI